MFAAPAARPVPYVKSDKYKFLGMYGSSDDITGGFGAEGVDAFQQFLDAGGTLITMGNAVRFPTEFGMARTVDASGTTSHELLRAAAARQRGGAAPRSPGVLRLHRAHHADQVPRRPADVRGAAGPAATCSRGMSAATRRC